MPCEINPLLASAYSLVLEAWRWSLVERVWVRLRQAWAQAQLLAALSLQASGG